MRIVLIEWHFTVCRYFGFWVVVGCLYAGAWSIQGSAVGHFYWEDNNYIGLAVLFIFFAKSFLSAVVSYGLESVFIQK